MVATEEEKMFYKQEFVKYCFSHAGGIFFVMLGVGGMLYSLLAKKISFQGDFPLTKEERKTYSATPEVRVRAFVISLLPLAYGIKLLLFP
jgi:hypothetical protein